MTLPSVRLLPAAEVYRYGWSIPGDTAWVVETPHSAALACINDDGVWVAETFDLRDVFNLENGEVEGIYIKACDTEEEAKTAAICAVFAHLGAKMNYKSDVMAAKAMVIAIEAIGFEKI